MNQQTINGLCGYLIRKVRNLIEFNIIEIENKLQMVVIVVAEWVRNPGFLFRLYFIEILHCPMFTVLLAPSGFAFCLFRSGLFLQPLSVVLHLLFLCFTLLHPFANYHAIAKYLLAHTVTLSLSLTVSSTHP